MSKNKCIPIEEVMKILNTQLWDILEETNSLDDAIYIILPSVEKQLNLFVNNKETSPAVARMERYERKI